MDSSDKMEEMIRKANEKWDPRLFTKWFGQSTAESDKNVKIRFQKAMAMMFEKKKKWKVLCCKEPKGACTACKGKVLAYVSSFRRRGSDLKYSSTKIRVCPLSFEQPLKDKELGLTIFHELMHMSSGAGDKGYSKL